MYDYQLVRLFASGSTSGQVRIFHKLHQACARLWFIYKIPLGKTERDCAPDGNAYGIHYMRTSELFLGKHCMHIYISDYVTEKEKKEMLNVGFGD